MLTYPSFWILYLMQSLKPILKIENLYYERNEIPLLQNINLQLAPGELLQIVGNNGAGKTTLLRILSGLLMPTSGEIYWRDKSIHEYRMEYADEILYIGHLNAIKSQLTVHDNLHLTHKVTQNAISTALKYLNLQHHEHRLACHLSAGQQRRLALAKLLTCSARLWILDEPLTALDKSGKILIEDLLKQHLSNNGVVILTSHQPLGIQDIKIKPWILDS